MMFRTFIVVLPKNAKEVYFHLVQLTELCRLTVDFVRPFAGHPGTDGDVLVRKLQYCYFSPVKKK